MPLLDRYDELKTKTRLSSDEQAELNSIITKITDNIPGVITKVGEYDRHWIFPAAKPGSSCGSRRYCWNI